MIKDRITELRRVKASDLIPNPKNWRKHPDAQRKAMKSVLDSIGYADALIARETPEGLMLIDGHLRSDVTPDQEVPVLVVNLTEEEADIMLATLDPLAGMADADNEALTDLLQSINFDDVIGGLLESIAKDNSIDLHPVTEDDPAPLIDKADELQEVWQVQTGDLWTIGKHRLLCGDCTVEADVKRLMDGKKADMVFTDPPYNVDYGANKKHPPHKIRTIKNDKMERGEWDVFVQKFVSVIKNYCEGDCYIWGAPGFDGMRMMLCFEDNGFHWSATIVWKKDRLVLTPAKYQRMYEPCLYGWFNKSSFCADRKQVEVWEVDRPTNSKEHPTMKPLELASRAIKNSSRDNNIIADFFLGSGSTMLAAEQTDRICYGMEIEPKYCAVTLQRMQDFGIKGVKL